MSRLPQDVLDRYKDRPVLDDIEAAAIKHEKDEESARKERMLSDAERKRRDEQY